MKDQPRDRRLLQALGVVAAIGLASVIVGVVGIVEGWSGWRTYLPFANPLAGVVGGAILLGFATAEAVHRLRRGPQSPGRHSARED